MAVINYPEEDDATMQEMVSGTDTRRAGFLIG